MQTHMDSDEIVLKQGTYWQPRQSVVMPGIGRDGNFKDISAWVIPAGQLLLLQSIRDVDHQAHTIVLRPHPADYDRHVWVAQGTNEEGEPDHWSREKLAEYRFLVDEFLDKFEPVPDPEPIRTAELKAAHDRIDALQKKLLDGQSNPTVLRPVLEAGIREWEKKEGITPEQSEAIRSAPVSTALVPTMTQGDVENMTRRAEREHQLATIRAGWIKERVEEISEAVQALLPYMEEKAACALASTEDVIRKIQHVQKGVESLNLYVLTDVTIETLRKGKSAPEPLPLTIAQQKLFMGEELSVWADVDDDFDFRDEAKFLDCLVKNDSLLNQIFPTERSIICMATRRTSKDYGDPWVDSAKNRVNKEVFLLVRDGENLYRVFSPVESHLRALQLFPSRSEANEIFTGADGKNIDFEDTRYTDRLERHDLLALHYQRFLVLLAGLDHRHNLFGKFYEGEKSTKFISLEFQRRYFHFLHDADGEGLLPGEAREPLSKWIDRHNEGLRSGSRVVCDWKSLATPKTAPGMAKENRDRSGFYYTRHPKEWVEITSAYTSNVELVVSCSTQTAYWESSPFRNTLVSLSNYERNYYGGGFGYLVLDAVNPDELDWYIHSRVHRMKHLSYIRLFKQAVAYLREERKREAPTRWAMQKALEAGNIGHAGDHSNLINQAVQAWRAQHRGAALPEKPTKELLDLMYTIQTGRGLAGRLGSLLDELDDAAPLRFIVTGANKLALYVSPKPGERDDRLTSHVWVHKFSLDWKRNGELHVTGKRWVVLPKAAASETTLFEWPESKDWVGLKSPFPSYEEKQRLFALVDDSSRLATPWLKTEVTEAEWADMFTEWRIAYAVANKGQSRVQEPWINFTIGLRVNVEKNWVRILSVRHNEPEATLWRLGTKHQREALENHYAALFRYASQAKERLRKSAMKSMEATLVATTEDKWLVPSISDYSGLSYANEKGHSSHPKDGAGLDARLVGAIRYDEQYHSRYQVPYMFTYIGKPFADQRLDEIFSAWNTNIPDEEAGL